MNHRTDEPSIPQRTDTMPRDLWLNLEMLEGVTDFGMLAAQEDHRCEFILDLPIVTARALTTGPDFPPEFSPLVPIAIEPPMPFPFHAGPFGPSTFPPRVPIARHILIPVPFQCVELNVELASRWRGRTFTAENQYNVHPPLLMSTSSIQAVGVPVLSWDFPAVAPDPRSWVKAYLRVSVRRPGPWATSAK